MENTFLKAQSAATKLVVKSAMNPALWFAGSITPVCFIAAWFFQHDQSAKKLLIIFGSIPIALVALAYLFFMLFDRDRLHSEEFQLKKLGLIKSRSLGELPDSENRPLLSNPEGSK